LFDLLTDYYPVYSLNKGGFTMANMPKRDIKGVCEGECEDLVGKMEKEQQKKIDKAAMQGSTAETPSVEHAESRDSAPGELGGHV
jgi:hypothetical protein